MFLKTLMTSLLSALALTTPGTIADQGADSNQVDLPRGNAVDSYVPMSTNAELDMHDALKKRSFGLKGSDILVDEGDSLGVHYKIVNTGTEYVLTISGSGEMSGDGYGAWRKKNTLIKRIVIEEGITSISGGAFRDFTSLEYVSLPSTLTTIGSAAFRDCSLLRNIDLPSNLKKIGGAFSGCASLEFIKIPEGVSEIAGGTFFGCKSLKKVVIPSTVSQIESDAFSACEYLKQIDFCGTNPINVIDTAFGGRCVYNSKKDILDCPYPSAHVPDINVPKNFQGDTFGDIKQYSSMCQKHVRKVLTSVDYPGVITDDMPETTVMEVSQGSCGTDAQYRTLNTTYPNGQIESTVEITGTGVVDLKRVPYSRMNNLIVNEGITSIKSSYSYIESKSLHTLKLPDSLEEIQAWTFYYCVNLNSVEFGKNLKTIGESAFTYCSGLRNMVIPDSVESVGENAFSGCKGLESVVLSSGMNTIQRGAFSDCVRLESVKIPGSITSIYTNAGAESYAPFYNCTHLNDVSYCGTSNLWESSVKDKGPFSKCDMLNEIKVLDSYDGGEYFCGVKRVKSLTSEDECRAEAINEGNCGDNIKYKFLKNEGILEISGEGEMCSFDNTADYPWYPYRDSIKAITIGNGVTSISSYAFKNYDNLESISIPETVESIGEGTFLNCKKLNDVNIPSRISNIGVSAFEGCISLETIRIPSRVSYVSDSVFKGCTSLENIEILSTSLSSIGSSSFENCGKLSSLNIPSTVKSIGSSAFKNCDSIQSVKIPANVNSIGANAFESCENLAEVKYCGTNIFSDNSIFKDCGKLNQVNVPETYSYYKDELGGKSVKRNLNQNCEIDANAPTDTGLCGTGTLYKFYQSTGRLEISGSGDMCSFSTVMSYPWNQYSSSIKSVEIGNGITSIGDSAFKNCNNLRTITIPATVTSIGKSAFYGCRTLNGVTLPENIDSIKDTTFYDCSALSSIIIPKKVTSIGEEAFYGCKELVNIDIPYRVSAIGQYAFDGCENLENVKYCGMNQISTNTAFFGCPVLEVKVPKEYEYNKFCGEQVSKVLDDKCEVIVDPEESSSSNVIPEESSSSNVIPEESSSSHVIPEESSSSHVIPEESSSSHVIPEESSSSHVIPEESSSSHVVPDPANNCEGTNYRWYGDTLIIGGTGEMCSINSGNYPWASYSSKAKNIIIDEGVTSISEHAFEGFTNLETLVIPESVKRIDSQAFRGCIKLNDVKYCGYHNIASEGSVFNGCVSLVKVAVPENYEGNKFCEKYVDKKLDDQCEPVEIPDPNDNSAGRTSILSTAIGVTTAALMMNNRIHMQY